MVWNDKNQNQVRDPDESGLSNVQVNLRQGATLLAQTQTAAGGEYAFANVQGNRYYTVVEFDPLYYSSTTANQRTIWLGSGATSAVNFGDFYSGLSAYLPLLVRATQ